jgi:hypothetical protein
MYHGELLDPPHVGLQPPPNSLEAHGGVLAQDGPD